MVDGINKKIIRDVATVLINIKVTDTWKPEKKIICTWTL